MNYSDNPKTLQDRLQHAACASNAQPVAMNHYRLTLDEARVKFPAPSAQDYLGIRPKEA